MNHLQKAKEILSACLLIPVEKIPDNGSLYDIQPLDSMAFESIVTEIEKTVGHEIEPMKLMQMSSVGKMAELLREEMP